MNRGMELHDNSAACLWLRWGRLASRTAAAGLLFTACACSSITRPVAKSEDPFLSDEQGGPKQQKQRAVADAKPASAKVLLRPAGAQKIVQTAYHGERPATPGEDFTITRVSADSRMPVDCPAACPTSCPTDCSLNEQFPDEYLCDGGDRDLPVHYADDQMMGLDTEDTVAQYRDEEGRRRVKPANKVCIYSPRFASVVSLSAPIEDVGGGRPLQNIASVRGMGLKGRDLTVAHNQTDMTERLLTRVRGSGLETDVGASELDRPEAIHAHSLTLMPLTDVGFLKTGQLHSNESAIIEKSIQAAIAWTRDESPAIVATTDGAGELQGVFTPAEMDGQENRFNGKGKLRIVKLADRDIAEPGEVITFKIRFDNLGDRPLKSVVIVDNLTPRLEYVEDSATCDRNGELFVDNNGEGSLILRWELDEPLQGRSGGLITFQARVR